jgi:uncharacterized protein involved in high-affinity Fe2+ transport
MGMTLKQVLGAAAFSAAIGIACATGAWAGESPAGQVLEKDGMQILGVFLQPVEMEPKMKGQDAAQTDIHLEADIHAVKDNKNGFPEDSWIPYLAITYELTKKGSDWKTSGDLMGMVANDGPHYGANVKLDGPGEYDVVFHISPPSKNGFMRHTDKETGVGPWWKPFDYQGSFKFVGTGKKGGY